MRRISILFVMMSLGLSACSILQRAENSGYADTDGETAATYQDFYRERNRKAWKEAQEELGYHDGHELSESDAEAVRLRVELHRLEKQLSQDLEKKQYYSLKPFFRHDAERVYFLKLPDREARERWANAKGLVANVSTFDPGTTQLIENNDIARGMLKDAVRQSWGDPDFVEVAGDPIYGNERWKYNKLVSTSDGYRPETRVVYFESGRVAGWETF